MAERERTGGLTPHLVVVGGAKAIDFYKKAFGAVEVSRMPEPGGGTRLFHAELKIGDASLFLCDDFPEFCGGVSRAPKAGTPASCTLHMDVANCDAAIDRAVSAGAKVDMPAGDMFWGDRYGKIVDPFGHEWSFAHKLTAEQAAAAAKAWAEQCGQG
jgi:PhnB protein